jgi:hypothetical protein
MLRFVAVPYSQMLVSLLVLASLVLLAFLLFSQLLVSLLLLASLVFKFPAVQPVACVPAIVGIPGVQVSCCSASCLCPCYCWYPCCCKLSCCVQPVACVPAVAVPGVVSFSAVADVPVVFASLLLSVSLLWLHQYQI